MKRWESDVERQLFEQMNQAEDHVGHPMPQEMRSVIHDWVMSHGRLMRGAKRRRFVSAVGTIGGWVGAISVMSLSSRSLLASLGLGLFLGFALVNAFFAGQAHQEIKVFENSSFNVAAAMEVDGE